MNKIEERFPAAKTRRAGRTRSAAARFPKLAHVAGNAQQPAIEEVTAESIEQLYAIWDHAPRLHAQSGN